MLLELKANTWMPHNCSDDDGLIEVDDDDDIIAKPKVKFTYMKASNCAADSTNESSSRNKSSSRNVIQSALLPMLPRPCPCGSSGGSGFYSMDCDLAAHHSHKDGDQDWLPPNKHSKHSSSSTCDGLATSEIHAGQKGYSTSSMPCQST
ncbi:hypothetical protein V8B97DRAFT_2011688 [Scleroderma yunnanense]